MARRARSRPAEGVAVRPADAAPVPPLLALDRVIREAPRAKGEAAAIRL
jgi:hypothetical protein